MRRTLLGEEQETRTSLTFRNIKMFLLQPAKECNPLGEDPIPLKVVCCYRSWGNGIEDLRRESAVHRKNTNASKRMVCSMVNALPTIRRGGS